MANKKSNGFVIYDGPSLLDPTKNVVVILIKKSGNSKTANTMQTFVVMRDIDPREANKSGQDYAICGACPHKGIPTDDPNVKLAKERTCYVVIGQSVLGVWRAYHRGAYPKINLNELEEITRGRIVRLGTYGDPSVIPSMVWDSLTMHAKGSVGYTHQLEQSNADVRTDQCMISADSLSEAKRAWDKGMRTFRIVKDISEIQSNEIQCPETIKTLTKKVTCETCMLCDPKAKTTKSIAMPVHGSGQKYFSITEVK